VRFSRVEALEDVARGIRGRLEPAFSAETAVPGTTSSVPSAGHCAAVALIVHAALGGDIASTVYRGESHWFNRVVTERGVVDVDLTGDQFGFAPMRLAAAGSLFADTRVRRMADARNETIERAITLATRAELSDAVSALRAELARREAPARATA
jgi:hypothetical protein